MQTQHWLPSMRMSSKKKPEVWLRADGNSQIGLGHVYRMLALAEMLQTDAELKFLIRNPDAKVTEVIQAAGVAIRALPADVAHEQEALTIRQSLKGDEVVVLDGYAFDAAYQRTLHGACGRLVYVDDLHAWPMLADVVINHAPGMQASVYADKAPHTQLCLGLDYLLLRQVFFDALALPRTIATIEHALICIGGADPLGITAHVLALLIATGQFKHISVVRGAANTGQGKIESPNVEVKEYQQLTAQGLIALASTADVAIVPASTVALELMHVGINMIVGYYTANQYSIYSGLMQEGLAIGIGDWKQCTNTMLSAALQTLQQQPAIFAQRRNKLPGNSKQKLSRALLAID